MIDHSELCCDGSNRWLVLDDLMNGVVGIRMLNSLFTMRSHRYNVSF